MESDGVKFTPKDMVDRTSLEQRAIQFMRDCGGPSKDIIAITYRKKDCKKINEKAVDVFNPQPQRETFFFNPRPKDRVICTRNTREPQSLIITVSNGELGTVTGIHSYTIHQQQGGEEHIFRDWDEHIDSGTYIVSVTMDIGRQVRYFTKSRFTSSFLWAYALTIHKVQGSEWTHVFYHPSSCKYQTGRASYTAGTRPSKHLVIDSDPETFRRTVIKDCEEDSTDERDDELYDLITREPPRRAVKKGRYQ